MAKVYGGFTANFYGKLGNVVGRVRQGRSILSIYQPKVLNPKTPSQQLARAKFSLLTKFMKSMSGFLKTTFHDLDGYKTGNPFSAAIGYNFKASPSVFSGSTASNVELVFSNLVVSQGSVDNVYSPSANADGANLTILWSDNSGMGNALADDMMMIVCYNQIKEVSVSSTELAARNERSATFTLPTAWLGDSVDVYVAVRRKEGFDCSKSIYVGNIPL